MLDKTELKNAIAATLAAHDTDCEKHPRPTWPVSSLQDAVEAADRETVTFGVRYGMRLMMELQGFEDHEIKEVTSV